MDELKQILASKFRLEHTTIQFECSNCGQGPENEVPVLNDAAGSMRGGAAASQEEDRDGCQISMSRSVSAQAS